MRQPRTYLYSHRAAGDLAADVYLPDATDVPAPVILWLHGGGLIFGSRKDVPAAYLNEFLSRGYVVVSVDYRLAPETKLPHIFSDVEDAYEWIRVSLPTMWPVDVDRISVVGQSAGGYLSLLASYRLMPRPRAIVSVYGYGDIRAHWYSEPSEHYSAQPTVSRAQAVELLSGSDIGDAADGHRVPFYIYCRQQGRWPIEVTGWDPETDGQELEQWCPVENVDGWTPPTLLMHGDQDTDVPCDQSMQMARALVGAGVLHRLIIIPGGEHGFDLAVGDVVAASAARDTATFIHEHMSASQAPRP